MLAALRAKAPQLFALLARLPRPAARRLGWSFIAAFGAGFLAMSLVTAGFALVLRPGEDATGSFVGSAIGPQSGRSSHARAVAGAERPCSSHSTSSRSRSPW